MPRQHCSRLNSAYEEIAANPTVEATMKYVGSLTHNVSCVLGRQPMLKWLFKQRIDRIYPQMVCSVTLLTCDRLFCDTQRISIDNTFIF